MGCPVKNDDFGGAFHPLAGKLFCVTENISRNGKHNLPSPETYNVPGTQKRVEHHAPFPSVRRPAQRGEHRVPTESHGTRFNRLSWSNATPTTATPTPTTAISARTRVNWVKCPFLCSRQQTSIDSIQQVCH